jgi:hypothetical protein
MRDLFGLELPTAVTFAIAFVVVLLLIGVLAWAVRRFGATRLEAARSRQPRLAVVDSAAVDGRRKLVIVRRDNVEHLLMIGGPTDVVVESSIVRGGAVAAREPAAVRAGADNLPRAMPLPDSTLWPLQPEPVVVQTMAPTPVPMPAPAPVFAPAPVAAPALRLERERNVRVSIDPRILTEHRPAPEVRNEPRLAPEPRVAAPEPRAMAPEPRVAPAAEPMHWPSTPAETPRAQQADHLAGLAAGLAADLARPTVEARTAPQPAHAVAPAPAALTHPDAQVAGGDQNLAEMAQRLEAALRRPMAQQPAQHVTAPTPHSVVANPAPQAPAQQAAPAPQPAPRPAQQRAAAAPKVVAQQAAAQPKAQYDNLEQEMASLLGRPGKT